jgi:hypothetical protein
MPAMRTCDGKKFLRRLHCITFLFSVCSWRALAAVFAELSAWHRFCPADRKQFRQNEAIKGFCGACRRENRLGRTRWNGVDRFAAAMEFSGGATGRRRHGVAGGGLGGVKLVGVGGWWTIEADGNRA